ncbi:MAG: cadherin-like beta sandwich domain-containing protein, partial [Chloroflexi bacterium]|nr:cadherin-like beta sandwich domain-containing protein [Chloroflexota bacterium]
VDSAAQSTDARLKALTGSTSTDGSDFSGTLDIGAFVVDDTEYAATVENAVTHVKITPTANEASATVRVGRRGSLAAVDSGEASGAIALEAGENVIDVEVTAEDGSTRKTWTVTVTREPGLTLTVDAANGTVAEDAGTVTVTARLDIAAGPGGLRVTLLAGSGTAATAAADYRLPGAFTIARGRTSATAEVTIVDDDIDEDDESLVLTATAGSLAVNGVTLTIADDDTAGVTVSDPSLDVIEDATATYTVVLDSKPAANVTVTPRSSDPGKATVSSPLTFTPANWDRAQPVTVTGVAEGAATVTHAVSSSDARYLSGLTIDSVAVTVASSRTYALTPSVTAAEGTDAVLTVTLGRAPPRGGLAFDVRYDYSGGGATSADTGTTPGTVRVEAGSRTATISVPITADYRIVDSGETFTVTIAPVTGVTGWSVAPGGTATSTVTITDNAARVTLDAAAYSFREGDPGDSTLGTTWRAQSYVSLSFVDVEWVGVTATDGVDYHGRSTRVGYTPLGDCQSQGRRKCGHSDGPELTGTDPLRLEVVDDDLVEGDETFTVTLRTPAGWSAAPIASATVTIVDNDAAAARIAFGNSAAGTSTYTASVAENVSGGTLEVPVTVSHLPGSPTTFEVEVLATGTAVEGADYRIGTKLVTFGPGTSKTQNLTIAIVDDTNREPAETIELRIAAADNPVNDLGDYYARNARGSRATLTVTNDDIPLPGFAPDGSVTVTDADTDITLTFAVPVKKDTVGGDFSGADLSNVLT